MSRNSSKELPLVIRPDGFACCRQCGGIMGKQDVRNLRIGVLIKKESGESEFVTASLLVTPASLRCPRGGCFARHKFVPPTLTHPNRS